MISILVFSLFGLNGFAATESLVGNCVAKCESVRHQVPANVELESYRRFCRSKFDGRVSKAGKGYICSAATTFNLGEIGIDSYRCNDMRTIRSWLQVCGELVTRDNKCVSPSRVTIENWSCDGDTNTTRLINYGIR